MPISYGLDIAGYSTGKSALARAKTVPGGNSIQINIIENHIPESVSVTTNVREKMI